MRRLKRAAECAADRTRLRGDIARSLRPCAAIGLGLAEESGELAFALFRDAQRPGIQVLVDPAAPQQRVQQGRAQRAAQVRAAFAPVQAGAGKAAAALARLRRKLGNGDDADRRFVRVLSAVLTDGLEPVEAAVREALATGRPVRSATMVWKFSSASRRPCEISGW